jgi:hypothetical protein
MIKHAQVWEPDARLVGNVTAHEIIVALETLLMVEPTATDELAALRARVAELEGAIASAIAASDSGGVSSSDAIQDMLELLDV